MKNPIAPEMVFMLILLIGALFGTSNANAQLSGTYTIDPGKAGSGTNYNSFADAITYLTDEGLNGPVVFKVANGIYKEPIKINGLNGVSGISATNTVTFQSASGDVSLVTIITPNAQSVVQLYQISYVSFSNMTIYETFYGYPTVSLSYTGNIGFLGCRIIKSTVDTNNLIQDHHTYGNSVYSNNYLSGGAYAIYHEGNYFVHGPTINGNQIKNCRSGIYLDNFSGSTVKDNVITLANRGADPGLFALCLSGVVGHTEISGNKINTNPDQYALYLINCNDTGKSYSLVYNNFMVGYVNVNNCDRYNFYFNNILVVNAYSTNDNAILFSGNSYPAKVQFYNNNVVNMNGGAALKYDASSTNLDADYNNYYTSGFTLNRQGTINYATISNWGLYNEIDANSISVYPGYYTKTDLHESNYLLYHAGTPIKGISNDIDGDLRNANNPDIGADEFIIVSNDLAVSGLVGINEGLNCGDSLAPTIVVQNLGNKNVTNVPVAIALNGGIPIHDTIASIMAGTAVNFKFKSVLNTINGGDFNIKAYTAYSRDSIKTDDTLSVTGYFIQGTTAPIVSDIFMCHPNSIPYTITAKKRYQSDILIWTDANGKMISRNDSIAGLFFKNSRTFQVQAIRNFKYNGGYNDTAHGMGIFSENAVGLSLNPKLNMSLDSLTVYPVHSGSFNLAIGNVSYYHKYNVTVAYPGQPVKIKVQAPNYLYPNKANIIFVDSITTGGLYANTIAKNSAPIANTLVSVIPFDNDSFYRYLYDLRFIVGSPCISPITTVHVTIPDIQPAFTKPINFYGQLRTGDILNPDIICRDSVHYNFSTIFSNVTYGKEWAVTYLIIWNKNNHNSIPVNFSRPVNNNPAGIGFFIPPQSLAADYYMELKVTNLKTGCDTLVRRYMHVNNSKARILSTGPFCSGLLNLIAQADSVKTYYWELGANETSTARSPLYYFPVAKNGFAYFPIKLITTDIDGCVNKDSARADVFGPPTASFTYNVDSISGNLVFVADDPAIAHYLWTFGDRDSSKIYKATHGYKKAGVYLVSLITTNSSGCSDTLTRAVLVTRKSGIESLDPELYSLNIFPNPTYNKINISYNLNKASIVSIKLLDRNGRLISEIARPRIQKEGRYNQDYEFSSDIGEGIYLLRMTFDNQQINKEIIVTR